MNTKMRMTLKLQRKDDLKDKDGSKNKDNQKNQDKSKIEDNFMNDNDPWPHLNNLKLDINGIKSKVGPFK